jgi:5-oxopent-3-ene-1,2,5-tricarboxylate decarboxylase/2-hydroxyhepta-2,4-diene-1,7-dioate isomerase
MHLARVRLSPESAPVLVVRVGETGGADELLPLRGLPGVDTADPIELLGSGEFSSISAAVQAQIAQASPADLLSADDVIFEPPVAQCSKICCLALNYVEHAEESSLEVPADPVLFFKPPSALLGHGGLVVAPARTKHVEYEVELAVVIGRTTRDLPADRWREAVAGYTIINDMTARDLQAINMQRNQPWDQAKGFDTFAPLGPYLVTADEIADPNALEMRLSVGGELRQKASTSQMVFDVPTLIADLSYGMTLSPGDIIATGTIAGLRSLRDGDVMQASIDGIGTLTNPLRMDGLGASDA